MEGHPAGILIFDAKDKVNSMRVVLYKMLELEKFWFPDASKAKVAAAWYQDPNISDGGTQLVYPPSTPHSS